MKLGKTLRIEELHSDGEKKTEQKLARLEFFLDLKSDRRHPERDRVKLYDFAYIIRKTFSTASRRLANA